MDLNNSLSATDLENWANAIEGREDITYETESEDLINEIIFDLANPILNAPLSPQRIRQHIAKLSNSTLSIAK